MAKRFTRIVCSNDEYTGSLFCDDEPLKIDAVCTLLNENEQLKQQIADDFNQSNCITVQKSKINDLEEENEQLKKENKRYILMVNCNSDLNDEIYEQLKKTEKNYKSLLNEKEQLINRCKTLQKTINDFIKIEEENEQLKSDLDYFKAKNGSLETGMFNLGRENEQLKSICQDHKDHAIDFKADCVRLEKENEQLKQQVKQLQHWNKCLAEKRHNELKGDVE